MLVVLLLLGEVLLDLLDVLVALRWRREDRSDLEGDELGVVGLALGLKLLEDLVPWNCEGGRYIAAKRRRVFTLSDSRDRAYLRRS